MSHLNRDFKQSFNQAANKRNKQKTEYLHNDVVDWYVDEFNKEPDKSHDCKADGSCKRNLLKFF